METTQTTQEPTQATEPTQTDPTPATEPQEPNVNDPAPGTLAEPGTPAPEPQQTTEPQSTTAPETDPAEPTEPAEADPAERVVPKPSEYELPEGTPDTIRIFGHEHGMTQEQLSATVTQFAGYIQGMQQTEQQNLRKAGETHVQNWGADAKTKLALAQTALKQNDPDGALSKALETSGYGNHPAVLDFLYSIGKSMQEGGFLKSAVPRSAGEKTAADAMYGDSHPTQN